MLKCDTALATVSDSGAWMRRLRWIFVIGFLALVACAGAVSFTLYDQYWTQLPPLSRLLRYDPPVATTVYADDGRMVGEFFFEKRYLTPIDEMDDDYEGDTLELPDLPDERVDTDEFLSAE